MTSKEEVESKLQALVDKYNTLTQLVIALNSGHGEWNTGKYLYEHWEEWTAIKEGKDGTLFAVGEMPEAEEDDDYTCPITDPELIEVINEMRPKAKKSEKKKTARGV